MPIFLFHKKKIRVPFQEYGKWIIKSMMQDEPGTINYTKTPNQSSDSSHLTIRLGDSC